MKWWLLNVIWMSATINWHHCQIIASIYCHEYIVNDHDPTTCSAGRLPSVAIITECYYIMPSLSHHCQIIVRSFSDHCQIIVRSLSDHCQIIFVRKWLENEPTMMWRLAIAIRILWLSNCCPSVYMQEKYHHFLKDHNLAMNVFTCLFFPAGQRKRKPTIVDKSLLSLM